MQDLIFNTHDIILLVTIYQSILFALLVWTIKHERHQSDYFLIGFLLTQAAIPLHLLVNLGDGFRQVALDFLPDSYRIFEIAYWLEGLLLLWYTRSLVYQNFKFTKFDLLLITPTILYLIYMVASFYILDSATKYNLLRDWHTSEAPFWSHIIGFSRETLRVVFSILCLMDIQAARRQLRNRYSNVDSIDFGWLNFLVVGFTFIRVWAVFVSVAIILNVHAGLSIDFATMGLIGNYVTFLLVSALIFFSLSRSSLFEGLEDSTEPPQDNSEIDASLVTKIENFMAQEKPFLDNLLTLEKLSSQLEMSPRTLSTIINRHFEQNFFEFINNYRVEEAKAQLSDESLRSKTMIDVMGDCGFNSKASFNTFFKKIVGSTPSQFRNKQLGQ